MRAAPLLALALAAVSCAVPPEPPRDVVVVGVLGEPASLFSRDPAARVIAAAVIETLVRRDARDELEPRLATTVPTFENGLLALEDAPGGLDRLVATFRLRPGLRWHDGAPLTAQDVVFAWREDRSSPDAELRYRAERVDSMQAADAATVVVRYRAGERWGDHALAPRAMPGHLLASATAAEREAYERRPVHAGPFAIRSWVAGHGATLEAFPGHALGMPELARIEVRFLPDRSAVIDALEDGEIDVAPSPALEADLARILDRLGGSTRTVVHYTPSEAVTVMRFGPAIEELGLRLAIERAVDRQRIADIVFAGRARVATSYLVAPHWAAAELGPPRPPDRRLARSLAQGAGYRLGEDGLLERGSGALSVTLLVADGSSPRVQAAHLVAADLAGVGIAAEVRVLDAAAVAAAIASGTFDLAVVTEPAHDAARATAAYRGAAGRWFDALASVAEGARERAERREVYAELQRIWSERLPALPLYQELTVDVAPARLEGVRPSPAGEPLTWNVGRWRYGSE